MTVTLVFIQLRFPNFISIAFSKKGQMTLFSSKEFIDNKGYCSITCYITSCTKAVHCNIQCNLKACASWLKPKILDRGAKAAIIAPPGTPGGCNHNNGKHEDKVNEESWVMW